MTVLVFGNFQRSLISMLVVTEADAAHCAMRAVLAVLACGCAWLTLSTLLAWSSWLFTLWLINLFMVMECLIGGPWGGGGPTLEAWSGLHWGKGTWARYESRLRGSFCLLLHQRLRFLPRETTLPSWFSDLVVPSVNDVCGVMQHLETACVKLLGPVCYNEQGFTYELFHK